MQGGTPASASYLCNLALSTLAVAMFHSNYNNGQSTGILHGKTRFGLWSSSKQVSKQQKCKTQLKG